MWSEAMLNIERQTVYLPGRVEFEPSLVPMLARRSRNHVGKSRDMGQAFPSECRNSSGRAMRRTWIMAAPAQMRASRACDRRVLVAAVVPHNDGVNGGVAEASAKHQGETSVDYYAGFDCAP
jgi:hypothetical protein